VVLNNISQIYMVKGNYSMALRCLEQSLQMCQDTGDKEGEGGVLNNLSQVYVAEGDYDTALQYLEQSLQIEQANGNRAGECLALFNIGNIHRQNDEQPQALSIWLKAYHIAKQIGWAEALQNLDGLAKDLGHEGLAWWETLSSAELAE
jgi:tetratricopeptide (TPR) repeat protein